MYQHSSGQSGHVSNVNNHIKTWSDRGLRAEACIGCRFVDMPLIISVLWLLCETGPCYYAWRGTRHLNMRGCQYIAGFFDRYPKVNISKHIWYVRRRRRQWIAEIAENCILTNIFNKKTRYSTLDFNISVPFTLIVMGPCCHALTV